MSDEVAKTDVRFSLLEKSLSAEFLADFPSYVQGLVRGDPGGLILTQKYADTADKYLNFTLRSDDVWIVTYPKCGNFDAGRCLKFDILSFICWLKERHGRRRCCGWSLTTAMPRRAKNRWFHALHSSSINFNWFNSLRFVSELYFFFQASNYRTNRGESGRSGRNANDDIWEDWWITITQSY